MSLAPGRKLGPYEILAPLFTHPARREASPKQPKRRTPAPFPERRHSNFRGIPQEIKRRASRKFASRI